MSGYRWLLAPLIVQAMAMGIDELWFHRRRGLGRWERMGHPVDTLTFVACVTWALVAAPTSAGVAGYVALSVVSCLVITKDEWVHARSCVPAEHWVHALLFVLHPIALASVGALWLAVRAGAVADGRFAAGVLAVEAILTGTFCVYQIAYWNLPWRRTLFLP